jgi:hypothetical protein
VRAATEASGLGAAGRRAARTRVDGALIAAAGLACSVMLLTTAAGPPALARGSLIRAHTTARWGVLAALLASLLLTALGVQMLAAAGRFLRRQRPSRRSARAGAQNEREERAVDPDDEDSEHDQPPQAGEMARAADEHAGDEHGEREVQLGLLGGGEEGHRRGSTLYLNERP